MKRTILSTSLVLMLVAFSSIRCGGASSLLSSGGPLISALSGAGNLGTMAKVLQTPGLGKLLGGALKGPFTLLAPTDNAFSGLGSGVLENLAKPENLSQLAGVLSKHVVPGKLNPADLLKGGLNSAAGSALNLGGVDLGKVIGDKKFNIIPIDKVLK